MLMTRSWPSVSARTAGVIRATEPANSGWFDGNAAVLAMPSR